jgi:hypothetical protein
MSFLESNFFNFNFDGASISIGHFKFSMNSAQVEEIEALEAIYGGDFQRIHPTT